MDESDISLIHEYIEHAHQAGHRMEAIIGFTREYENFGGVSAGWEYLFQIIESAKTEIPVSQVTIENSIPGNLEIYCDPIIRKVFSTLMENGIRHGKKITTIQFSSFEKDTELCIIYEDDGIGISEAEKEFIFHQGFGKHTGLGLFLAREILSITELTIRECGEAGKGARFEIHIPAGKFRREKRA
jgi:signal transduction histidine kinase